jgi:antitoxin (DNA-binding transcriptional repressor) of toxin-antitoxin stability system
LGNGTKHRIIIFVPPSAAAEGWRVYRAGNWCAYASACVQAQSKVTAGDGTNLFGKQLTLFMQTYAVESPNTDLAALAHLAANGQEVLLTEHNKPIAKLVPLDHDKAHRRKVQELQGFLRGMDTNLDRGKDDRV